MAEDREKSKQLIGNLLVEANLLTRDGLEKAIAEQKKTKEKFSRILSRLGLVEEEALVSFLGKKFNIPYINLLTTPIDVSAVDAIRYEIAKKYLLFPCQKENGILTVAMVDPLNTTAINELVVETGYQIKPLIASESAIRKAIRNYYEQTEMGQPQQAKRKEVTIKPITEGIDIDKIMRQGAEAPLINLVNHILEEAVNAKASDIHIEPYEQTLRIRYRIDGILYEVATPPKQMHHPIISRLKIMAEMDIAERRLPQDGRCKIRIKNRDIDFRVSTIPANFGEKCVMRILDSSSLCVELTDLGFEPDALAVFEKHINVPHGMILVTGPTGSGKSTTLYSALRTLNTPEKNIMTIEDPIEYVLAGVNQIQAKPEIGFDFASGLRSFMRQDPDIILVGEIRDRETGEVAINAALTGHLVLSTLHTNEAAGSVTRLVNMGVEPFLISSTLVMVVAQRLVRKLCSCKEPYEVSAESLKSIGIDTWEEKTILYKPKGCEKCVNIGYKGRMGVYEILVISEDIRDMIVHRETSYVIQQSAIKSGMVTLREAAIRKVLSGATTIDEMMRIVAEAG
ncbi:Flp pilus assembly complex ATPase component TadA [bacterium]|nr:Flp pilus assembly complex ATPase component TadA [bacterium]